MSLRPYHAQVDAEQVDGPSPQPRWHVELHCAGRPGGIWSARCVDDAHRYAIANLRAPAGCGATVTGVL